MRLLALPAELYPHKTRGATAACLKARFILPERRSIVKHYFSFFQQMIVG